MYSDVEEALAAGATRLGFREMGRAGGGKFEIFDQRNWGIAFSQIVRSTAAQWTREGRIYVLDSAVPNTQVTLLGEVTRTYRGLEGFLGVRTGLTMRESIAKGLLVHRSPMETKALIDYFMDPSSRDDLEELLEMFPDAAIEFACFPINVGVIPRRNTIFWEVRNY